MKDITSFLSRLTLAFVVSASLNGCDMVTPLHTKSIAVNVNHLTNKPLKVTSANGSIEVRQDDRSDVQVTAEVRAISLERLEQVTIHSERDTSGALVIHANWPEKRKSREGCHFTIAIPDANGVDLKSSNGALKIDRLGGEMRLKTSNGSITANHHNGSVTAETSNGRVELRDIAGNAAMISSNGKIEAANINGAVQAKTSNGSIKIALATDSKGPIDAKSSNGSVTLVLGQGFGGTLDLSTSNGSVTIDDRLESYVVSRHKKKQARLQIGSTGAQSKATTSNGSIRVERVH